MADKPTMAFRCPAPAARMTREARLPASAPSLFDTNLRGRPVAFHPAELLLASDGHRVLTSGGHFRSARLCSSTARHKGQAQVAASGCDSLTCINMATAHGDNVLPRFGTA